MVLQEPIADSYLIEMNQNDANSIRIKATLYSEGQPVLWAVLKGDLALNQLSGHFDYSSVSSNNDEIFVRAHRFDSVEEAFDCFVRYYPSGYNYWYINQFQFFK